MRESGIVRPFHKVGLHAEKAGDNLSHSFILYIDKPKFR